MKRCSLCKEEKPLGEFYKNRCKPDGLQARCRECHLAYYYRRRDEINARRRQDRRKNPDRWKRRYDPERDRAYRVRKYYGLSLDEYDALLAEPCAICGGESEHLDHDHNSGAVRGGLCAHCNQGLGHFKDDLTRLSAAMMYLGNAYA